MPALLISLCCNMRMQAGAYRTILTHFSQRYPKIPKIEKSFLASTCIAFDLMSINLQGMCCFLPDPELPSATTAQVGVTEWAEQLWVYDILGSF